MSPDTPRPRRAAAAALSFSSLIAAGYLAPGWQVWASPATLAVSGALVTALVIAAATMWRGSRHQRTVGATVLLAGAVLLLLDAAGMTVTSASTGPMPYALLLSAASAVAAIGVLFRRRGGRWLALGLAGAGAISSGLNLSMWMMAGVVDGFGWALAIWTVGSLAVIATLSARAVAADDRLSPREEVWNRADPAVKWMRAATITAIVATPMLLVYAFMQAGAVASLTPLAEGLAALLALAAFLGGRGLLVGGALLGLGGLALFGLSTAAVALAPAGMGVRIAAYYLVFWLPAAGCGLACAIALACSAIRLPARPR